MAVDAPMLWSAESPDLYELLITLYDADGNIVEIIRACAVSASRTTKDAAFVSPETI